MSYGEDVVLSLHGSGRVERDNTVIAFGRKTLINKIRWPKARLTYRWGPGRLNWPAVYDLQGLWDWSGTNWSGLRYFVANDFRVKANIPDRLGNHAPSEFSTLFESSRSAQISRSKSGAG